MTRYRVTRAELRRGWWIAYSRGAVPSWYRWYATQAEAVDAAYAHARGEVPC